MRSGPPLEEEAAVGFVGVDAHSKDTALEVGVSANNVEALLGLLHVLSGDRADDGSAEDVVFRIVRRGLIIGLRGHVLSGALQDIERRLRVELEVIHPL